MLSGAIGAIRFWGSSVPLNSPGSSQRLLMHSNSRLLSLVLECNYSHEVFTEVAAALGGSTGWMAIGIPALDSILILFS